MTTDEKRVLDKETLLIRDTGLALLRVAGEDATRFLDAQTTATLGEDAETAHFTAIADPKGRVRATFYAWRAPRGWLLALAAGEVEWLGAHLARFVFRSRVQIAPAPEVHLLGVSGAEAAAALAAAGLPAPEPGQIAHAGALAILRLMGARWLVVGETAAVGDVEQTLAPETRAGHFEDWKRARLAAGEVEIRTETRDRFLPQMLGLVELGAVSFRKGCYPGQEVIARTRNLGRIKRAMTLLQLDGPLEAGTSADIEGARIEVLDNVALEHGALVQAIAPLPLPTALQPRLYSASSKSA